MVLTADVLVLGVGGMGSAACYHLAKRGVNVIGLEQFKLAHDRGSSHGETRVIRKAYFEHPDYVPLLTRAYELWDELGRESSRTLFHRVGILQVGPENGGRVLPGIEESASRFLLPVKKISREDTLKEFPHFCIPEGYRSVLEMDAGFLEVENSIRAHANIAKMCGAKIKANETVLDWQADADGVTVKTAKHVYKAAKLVIAAGAWSSRVLKDLRVPVTPHRNVSLWFAFDKKNAPKAGMPCFSFDMPDGIYYGFPAHERHGLKAAEHAPGEPVTDPAEVDRHFRDSDVIHVSRFLGECLPWVSSTVLRHSICLYEMTPDGHFIVDKHPRHDNVVIAAGFSGHGFKFCTVMGEILADLALAGETTHPIGFLGLRRFSAP